MSIKPISRSYSGNHDESRVETVADSFGRTIRCERYDQYGALLHREEIEYDESPSCYVVQSTEFDDKQHVVARIVGCYDRNERLIELEKFNSDGKKVDWQVYDYSPDNERVTYTRRSDAGLSEQWTVELPKTPDGSNPSIANMPTRFRKL